MNDRWKPFQMADLQIRKRNLTRVTNGGKPVFSWIVPAPNVSDPALAAFLRSNQPCPTEIVIKEGMDRAKHLATWTLCGHDFKFEPTYETRIKEGVSADVVAQGDYKRAVIMVTKTREYYDAKVTKYEIAAKAMKKVNDDLR